MASETGVRFESWSRSSSRLSFLFLVANTPWVYALAEALAANYPTHATRFYDQSNYKRLMPHWEPNPPEKLQRSLRVLPPGYVGQLEPLFRPYLQWQVQDWVHQLQSLSGVIPWIMVPYPHSATWVRHIASEQLIYYNLDDYVQYQPQREAKILAQEVELVNRSALTLCLAQTQVKTLQERYPERARAIHHFPLGVVDTFINPNPARSPESMTVGYIGNLSDRIDWQLVRRVAERCPEATFVFVGELDGQGVKDHLQTWKIKRSAALALDNVRHLGKVPQIQVCDYYWNFAVNWIPYDVSHPFNQASCPTKIMDGIASARPVISTDIPECRLYPDWITIFHSIEEAVQVIREYLTASETLASRQKREQQRHFAIQQTWQQRANTLCHRLMS